MLSKNFEGTNMHIQILDLVEGAKKATGVAVIIDVFNAFSVEAYISNNNAKTIIPIGDEKIAYQLKQKTPSLILVGERHGKILPGFDYPNSPTAIESIDFTGKTIVHTTSAGTQGISNAINADIILTGSLVNAKAIAEYIKNNHYKEVSLVCMGFETKQPTSEDTLCARYIKDLLENNDTNYINQEIENLKTTSCINFFDKKTQDIFPETDFYLCTQLNKFNFVLEIIKDKNIYCVKKINL